MDINPGEFGFRGTNRQPLAVLPHHFNSIPCPERPDFAVSWARIERDIIGVQGR